MVGPGRGHGHGIGGATVQHTIQCATIQKFTHACIHHHAYLVHTLLRLGASNLYNLNALILNLLICMFTITTLDPTASINHRNEAD